MNALPGAGIPFEPAGAFVPADAPRILLVENGADSIAGCASLLRGLGYDYQLVGNLRTLEERIREQTYHIAIVPADSNPRNESISIRELKMRSPEIECIAFGSGVSSREMADLLREYRIFDFLFEPLDPEQLSRAVRDAFALCLHRRKAAQFHESEKHFHEKVMSIFDWKNELRAKRMDGAALSLIKQLNMSLFGGGGIGSLLTAVSMAMDDAEKEANGYRVSGEMFELLREHYELALRKVRALSDAHRELAASNRPDAPLRIGTLPAVLFEQTKRLEGMLALKEQQIVVGSLPDSVRGRCVNFDAEKMHVILNELYINAMKYSRKGDLIYTLLLARGDFLEIKILNPAYPDSRGVMGIDPGDELKVFEPFYRNSDMLHEEYDLEIFDSGMGLAVVKKIVENHGASVYIHTIRNHASPSREHDVCVTIRCPLLDSGINAE